MKSPTVKHVNASPSPSWGNASLQRGLSLIELMISIAIGLLILASLSTLFVNQSKTRAELDKSNRMIDNGRYALEVLSENLRMAGYYGEFYPSSGVPSVPAALPDPCTIIAADIGAAMQLAVQGYDAAAQVNEIAGPPCGFTYTAGNDRSLKSGSDILAMRRASTATPIVQTAALAGTHYLQVSHCQYDAVPYKISTVPADLNLRQNGCTNGSSATWSSVTTYALNYAVQYSGITYVSLAGSNLNNTPSATIGTWWKVGGGGYSDLRNFLVQVYFVSPSNNTTVVVPGSGCAVGDCIPTLKRYELDPTTHVFVVTPLVEGIEYMQVDYGLDTGTDGAPDSYVAAPTAAQWPNVVAVRMNILARNNEPTQSYTDTKTYTLGIAGTFGPFNDHYKRHTYTQFIRLTNPAGRREQP